MSTRTCPSCQRVCHGCDDARCGDQPCGECAQAELAQLRVRLAELVIQFEGLNQSHTETTEERDSARADNARLREALRCVGVQLDSGASPKTLKRTVEVTLAATDSREWEREFGMRVAEATKDACVKALMENWSQSLPPDDLATYVGFVGEGTPDSRIAAIVDEVMK